MLSSVKKRRLVGWIVFAVYIAVLFKITVFRQDFLRYPLFSHGELPVPLHAYKAFLLGRDYGTFLYLFGGNIAWFIPFGCLLPYLTGRPRKLPAMLLFGFLLSFLIEFLQYAFGTGESELDDLVLNTAGAALGFLLFRAYIRYGDKTHAAAKH